MIRSFRLRMALAVALLSGLVLLAFGSAALWQLRRGIREETLRSVRSHAEREAGRPPREADWNRTLRDMGNALGTERPEDLLLLVRDERGRTVYRSPGWPLDLDPRQFPWPSPAAPPPGKAAARPVTTSLEESGGGRDWLIGLAAGNRASVAVALDRRTMAHALNDVDRDFLVALPLALFLIAAGAWILSARALRPVHRLASAIREVTIKGLDRRIPAQRTDREFVTLIEMFNGMLERLERSVQQTRRFSGDAAHELRTPLSILQGQLERTMQQAESGSALQVDLSSSLDEIRRLSNLTAKLLLLAQADAGKLPVHREPVRLDTLLADMLEDLELLAPDLPIHPDIASELSVEADPELLRQILHNLLSNAVKYNVEDGWIGLSAWRTPAKDGIEIRVVNPTEPLPQEDRERLFERFHRADPSRSRRIEGVGLGLALSREIARAHGGELDFSMEQGCLACFRLTLPLLPTSPEIRT